MNSKRLRKINPTIKIARTIGLLALLISTILHSFILFSFNYNSDQLSIVTVFPIWFWSAIGLGFIFVSIIFLKKKLLIFFFGAWIITALLGSDEFTSLKRGLKPTVKKSKTDTDLAKPSQVLRVASINCNDRKIEAALEAINYNPDIIFLQESPSPADLQIIKSKLLDPTVQIVGGWDCSIIAKGKLTKRNYSSLFYNHATGAMLTLEDGSTIELLCIHLESAVTRWDLWNKKCWKEHQIRSQERRDQLKQLLSEYEKFASNGPKIFGGDFNSPQNSNLFKIVSNEYTNAFSSIGKGIGNTFTNYFPVIRIDHIYSNSALQPIDASSIRTVHSDHRMLICDFILKQKNEEIIR